jgi:hypothetical protein
MDIRFFDDPLEGPRGREDVRIRQIGLFVYPEERRFMFGIELTPFVERPSIEVLVTNGAGEPAGSLHVIETLTTGFSLVIHLRDRATHNPYELTAVLYYAWPDRDRQEVERRTVSFDMDEAGERLFKFDKN